MTFCHISHIVTGILVLVLSAGKLNGQTYTIPFAEKQPAWVFPLWFTNGDGQRDTIYLAYDFTASSAIADSVFGEYTMVPNEIEFYIRTGPNRSVYATDKLTYAIDLSGYNIVYPFTVSYDANLIYSDSLPGTPSDVVPKVWARLDGTGLIEGCPNIHVDGFTVILVDTVIEGYPSSAIDDPHCLRDSLVVVEGLISISVGLMEWNPPTGVNSDAFGDTEEVSFWFEGKNFVVNVNSQESCSLRLFQLNGALLYEMELQPGNYQIRECMSALFNDTYSIILVNIVNSKYAYSKQLLVK